MNLSTGMSISNPNRLSSTNNVNQLFFLWTRKTIGTRQNLVVKSANIIDQFRGISENRKKNDSSDVTSDSGISGLAQVNLNDRRKTKIVCTIGPSTSSREMIWKLAEAGMNVARLNMSHGDHASHQKTIDLVKEYNAQFEEKVVAIMLDTKGPEVRSGDVVQPILLKDGQEFCFTIKRGVSTEDTVSVNYDDFVNDVEVGDVILVDGGMMSLAVKSKTKDLVKCEVIDGGELKSRRHLNVRGKSANLPSITDKDWEDIKFGVDNEIDFYAVSFVKDAKVVHELKQYLKSCNADIHVTVKIESADSIPNLHSIISASDGAMVARGDLGAELPIEDVPILQLHEEEKCFWALFGHCILSWQENTKLFDATSSPTKIKTNFENILNVVEIAGIEKQQQCKNYEICSLVLLLCSFPSALAEHKKIVVMFSFFTFIGIQCLEGDHSLESNVQRETK